MRIILRNSVHEGEKGEILRYFRKSSSKFATLTVFVKIDWGGGVERLD
jgi:hypothetical protein